MAISASMGRRWPQADSEFRLALLAGAAIGGVVGAVLLTSTSQALTIVGTVLVSAYALSHAGAVGRVSPRLATLGVGFAIAGMGLFLIGRVAPSPDLVDAGIALAWIGVAALATAQWFDNRRTFGMAGLGIIGATLGALTYTVQEAFGLFAVTGSFAASWPGGTEAWRWLVVPWRLAFLMTLAWLAGSGGWLIQVHLKEYRGATATAAAPSE